MRKNKLEPTIFFAIIILGCIANLYLGITLKSLPSELYGGDFYYQLGSIYHICRGGNILESSSINGGLPGYLPLYGCLVCIFTQILNLNVLKGILLFSTLIYITSFLLWFILWKIIFNDTLVGIAGALVSNPLQMYLILKYTDFSYAIILPLLFIFLFLAIKSDFKNKTIKNIGIIILFSFFYGMSSLSHVVLFVGFTFIILAYLIYLFSKKEFKKAAFIILGLLVIAFPLSMLYWHKPIFKYHLKMKYDRTHTDVPDFAKMNVALSFLKESIVTYFLNVSNLYSLIISMFICIGIFFFFFSNVSKRFEYIFPMIIGGLVVVYSYFFTEPFFGMNLIPTYQARYFLGIISSFFFTFGLYAVTLIKNIYQLKEKLITVLILVLFFLQLYLYFNKVTSNDKYISARNLLPENYRELQNFLLNNSNVNDVLASTKELSFAINGLSGIKLLTNRWAQQNDPYMNFSQRDLDAAILFYGNNLSLKMKIIKKYNISWFYWDYYWIFSEYTIDEKGRIIGWYDPLIVWDTKENRKILEENGIKYIPTNTWIDPWAKGKKYRKFHVLLISPENYFNFTHPWNPNLDNILEEKWNFTYNHKKIARLFKIKKYNKIF